MTTTNLAESQNLPFVLPAPLFRVPYTLRGSTVLGPLHLSRTLYKSAFFMQNKPNFPDTQMNVTKVLTKDYENRTLSGCGKNKPNTKPKQSQTNPIPEKHKMNVSYIITKGYENKSHFWVKAKQTQYKPNQTQFRRQMLLIYAPLEVLEKSIMTGYYLEPIRHIKS